MFLLPHPIRDFPAQHFRARMRGLEYVFATVSGDNSRLCLTVRDSLVREKALVDEDTL
jgi:hypothetical protein